jgi:thiol-disulfide isomerase/thioredoxin
MNGVQTLSIVTIVALFIIYEKYKEYNDKPKVTMIWFYKPGCGFCDRMSQNWDEFKLSKPSHVTVRKVNTLKEQQMAQDFRVNGVPHIVKIVNGKIYVFNDDRTTENFLRFAME